MNIAELMLVLEFIFSEIKKMKKMGEEEGEEEEEPK